MIETLPLSDGVSRYHLRTLGTLGLSGPGARQVLGAHGHHRRRLALLSVLAVAHEQGRSRDQLIALFWSETAESRARHSLDQLLYAVRTSLGEDVFTGVNPVSLNPAVVSTDVGTFMSAFDRGDAARAVAEYRGPFLDGFHLGDSLEFERWLETERAALAGRYSTALERLARSAEVTGDYEASVQWWRKLGDVDPLNTRNLTSLVQALMRAGDHTTALQCVQRHEALLARELGVSAGPEVAKLVAELRGGLRPQSAIAPLTTPTPAIASAPVEDMLPIHASAVSGSPTGDYQEGRTARRRRRLYAIGITFIIAVFAATATLPHWTSKTLARPPAGERTLAVLPPLARTRRGATSNVAAYEDYSRGNDPSMTRNDSSVRVALGYFERAIALDPRYAAAYAGLARMEMRLASSKDTTTPRRERLRLAESAALTAVALDDSLADAHATLSAVKRNDYQFASAEAELKRAVALEPGAARFHEWLVQLYVWMDRPAEALIEGRQAVELDPLSATANAELAHALLANGRCDEALAQLAPLRLLRPPLLRAGSIATQCYASKGMWPDAIAEATRNLANAGPSGQSLLGFVLARAGRTKEARSILESLLQRSQQRDDFCGEVATVYAGLGDRTETWAWLERARDTHTLVLDHLSLVLDRLRPDPRVDLFRRQLGLQNR